MVGAQCAGPRVGVHATPAWSRAHLEQSATWVSAALEHALRAHLPGLGPSVHAVAHRWRYALVEQAIGVPFGWDETLGLGACGDGWLGARRIGVALRRRPWRAAGGRFSPSFLGVSGGRPNLHGLCHGLQCHVQ